MIGFWHSKPFDKTSKFNEMALGEPLNKKESGEKIECVCNLR